MSKSIRFFDFHGMTPRLDDSLLNSMGAMLARDVDLSRGDLMPFRWATEPVATRANDIVTMIDSESNCGFITWDDYVDVDLGQPVCNDIGMMFWIEDGVVMQATRSEACAGQGQPLGVPCPTQAPGGGGAGGGGEGCATVEAYCYTYVNEYGQEGPPSPIGNLSISGTGGGGITIPATTPQRTVHVYRAVADGSTGRENSFGADGEWLRVGEGLTGTTVQTRPVNEATEALRSIRWAPPPQNITALQVCPTSNTLMLASGNQIYISYPGQYHAFPRDRDLTLQDNVRVMRDYAGQMVVLTDGHPYVITPRTVQEGPHLYTVDRLDSSIPVVSNRSVSVGTSGVVWASRKGIYLISNGRYGIRATCLTTQLFHLDDYRGMGPTTIRGEIHNGAYYFTSGAAVRNSITNQTSFSWILTFNDEVYDHPTNVQLVSLSIRPDMWHQTRRDVLYYSIGNELFEWNPLNGEFRPYVYVTRDTVLQGLTALGAAKIHYDENVDGDPLVVDFLHERCSKPRSFYRRTLTHCNPFRLPGCQHSIRQFVQLSGTSRVRDVHLATTVRDLTNHTDSTYNHGNSRRTQR